MMKDIAWHFFKKTGNISAFLEYKNLEDNNADIQIADVNSSQRVGDFIGDNKDKRDCNKSGNF